MQLMAGIQLLSPAGIQQLSCPRLGLPFPCTSLPTRVALSKISRRRDVAASAGRKPKAVTQDPDVNELREALRHPALSSYVANAYDGEEQFQDEDDYEEDDGAFDDYDSTDEPPQESVEERYLQGEKLLLMAKADYTISSLMDKIKRGKLDLRPSYQRDYVWDKRTASRLIESLLLNIPVPTVFFHEKERSLLEVVDGKQRLTSIWSFMEEGSFPDGTEFALSGLEVLPELNDKKFADLDDASKENLRDYAINVHTISRNSDSDVVFEVFERLNMGSTQLNEQELRNCIYQGKYNDLLEELVRTPAMLQAMRLEVPHKRMKDREMVLRFFALVHKGIEGFRPPVKGWLNDEMREHSLLTPREKESMSATFRNSIDLSLKVFGDNAFRKVSIDRRSEDGSLKWDSELQLGLWDILMYGFYVHNDERRVLSRREEIQQGFIDLFTQDNLGNNLNSTAKGLQARWKLWNEMLMRVLGEPEKERARKKKAA